MKIRGFEIVKENMMKGYVKGLEPFLPQRGTSKAMAYDFIAPKNLVIKPGEIGKIWTNVKAYMGDNECLILQVEKQSRYMITQKILFSMKI